jgi:uncharacterized membrane protein HdeD (DUF308 family)
MAKQPREHIDGAAGSPGYPDGALPAAAARASAGSEMSSHAEAVSEQSFWLSLISGIILIAAGIGIWLHPEWFIPFVGLAAIVEGARLAWQGLFAQRDDGLDGLRVLLGVLAVVLGVGIWLAPDKAAPIVLYLVTGWGVVFGLFLAWLGFRDMGSVPGWGWQILVGLALVAFSLAVWAYPQRGGLAIEHIVSVLLIVAGIGRVIGAVQSRSTVDSSG